MPETSSDGSAALSDFQGCVQPLATDLLAQVLRLQQFQDISLSLQTALGCHLAEMLAQHALHKIQTQDALSGIPLLEHGIALISQLELDGDDPSIDQQSARVQDLHSKVGRVANPGP